MNLRGSLLASLVLATLVVGSWGFKFDIVPHQERCFYETVTEGTPIGIIFQVTAGGFLDIDFAVTGPDQTVIHSGDRETEGKYSFLAHLAGSYSFCFSNKMSTMTTKTISLHIHAGSEQNLPEKANPARKTHLSPLENSVLALTDGLNAIYEDHEYLKTRERVHRATMDSTHSRVVWWTIFEAVVLISLGVWQIYSIRRVFETTRPV
jgi:hypothetical protein